MTLESTGAIVSSSKEYKEALVSYIADQDFDWFGTIGIGFCPSEGETLRRLRLIDAIFSKKYLSGRYHKLPSDKRFFILVAFEGEQASGDLHAHLLVRIPTLLRKGGRSMLLSAFPFQFRFVWDGLSSGSECSALASLCPGDARNPIEFGSASLARKIYAVKWVQASAPRFEVIPPPKWRSFENENLKVIRNRVKQKRALVSA
jgi:hypothetical protein